MSIPLFTKDLAVIQKLSDLPNSTDGLTASELKAKFDEASLEIQRWMNNTLIPALTAANIPFDPTVQLNAQTVQDAVQLVFEQVRDASSGTIANGSVTKEKIAQALLERIFGGRVWVSLDKPTANDTPAEEFPVGQIWLRPGFTVNNSAGTVWTVSGCTVVTEENTVTVTGNNTVATADATQLLANIGQDGDRVYVLFGIRDKDSEITSLTVSLNGREYESTASTVHTATLSGGALSLRFRAVWPSTSLAKGSFTIENLAVVNVDAILRQTADCRDMADWGTYLESLLPLNSFYSPREQYIQTNSGVWEQFDHEVFPVHRGGTGLSEVKAGELLCGSGTEVLERVEVPEEDCVLQFAEGRPRWHRGDELASSLSLLRKTEGSYVGDGVNGRTVELPVEPVMLAIRDTDGKAFSLMNGQTVEESIKGSGSSNFYSATAGLDRKTLTFGYGGLATIEGKTTALGNKNGVTYNWVAIY